MRNQLGFAPVLNFAAIHFDLRDDASALA